MSFIHFFNNKTGGFRRFVWPVILLHLFWALPISPAWADYVGGYGSGYYEDAVTALLAQEAVVYALVAQSGPWTIKPFFTLNSFAICYAVFTFQQYSINMLIMALK